MSRVYSIGHSNHPIDRFIAFLHEYDIVAVADVRSHPYSRWAPQFRKKPLAQALTDAAIEYVFLGNELGGRPQQREYYDGDGRVDYARRALAEDFVAGIQRLIARAHDHPTAIMCAEEDPGRCHRHLLIAPSLRSRGVEVVHIRGDGRTQSADLTGNRTLPRQLSLFR
ncbi:MAG: DUF488 domain-containing protein [Proteobacteria bacterium]|nr:DUF488 domain-containing protein [Pseudomonadota bacterium]